MRPHTWKRKVCGRDRIHDRGSDFVVTIRKNTVERKNKISSAGPMTMSLGDLPIFNGGRHRE